MAKVPLQVTEFDVETDRKNDQLAPENRFGHPENPEGITTDTMDRQQVVEQAIQDSAREAVTPELSEENEYLKRRLGEQGNEIGELRRRAAEAEALKVHLTQLERRMESLNRPPSPQSIDLFNDIPQDQSYMSPAEKARVNQTFVALAQAVQTQIEALRNETSYHAGRAASGVSDAVEAEIVSQHPWINSLAGKDRAAAVVEMAQARTRDGAAPQRKANEAARSAARAAAYVESPSRVSEASGSDDFMETAQQKLLRDARAGKFRTATEMRDAMRKAGISTFDSEGRRY